MTDEPDERDESSEESLDDWADEETPRQPAMVGSFADRAIARQRLRWRLLFLAIVFAAGFVVGRLTAG